MPNAKFQIRRALPADAAALTKCMTDAYSGYVSRLGGKPLPPMEVDYEEEIRDFPVWVAVSEDSLVGAIILMPGDQYLTIANVAVNPQFQGGGAGRALMDFGEAEARRQGLPELRLATHVKFDENVSLYVHLGWSEIDRDDTRVYMKKDLAGGSRG